MTRFRPTPGGRRLCGNGCQYADEHQHDGGIRACILIPALLVRAVGQPLVMVPLSVMSLANLRQEDAPSVSTLYNVMRNLGGAVGVALLATLLTKRTQFHSIQLQETLLQGNQNAVEYLRNLGQVLGWRRCAKLRHAGADHQTPSQRDGL